MLLLLLLLLLQLLPVSNRSSVMSIHVCES